jgi:hypothetical protein
MRKYRQRIHYTETDKGLESAITGLLNLVV